MPSNSKRFFGALASIAITVGGAWLASHIHSRPAEASTTAKAESLQVTLRGVRNGRGNVIVMVFDNSAAYDSFDLSKAVGYQEEPAQEGHVTFRFPELSGGPYAVTAFHDENGNQDLDMTGQIPTEGYATSGASDAYDTPAFSKAAIASGSIAIQMVYLK